MATAAIDERLERLADKADQLEMLIDHFEIREVLESYIHACDRADRDAVAEVYHEDSFDDHGHMKSPGHEYATAVVDALKTKWESCNHVLGQSRIKVTGDSAGAETLFYATQTRLQDGVMMLDQQLGRYIDKLERRQGQWRFKLRRCVMEWATSGPLGESFVDPTAYFAGLRSGDDLSYELLGLKPGSSQIQR